MDRMNARPLQMGGGLPGMGETPEGFQRLNLPWRKTAHLLGVLDSPNSVASAVCGIYPGMFGYWAGTGSQDEIEAVAEMPLCKRCVKILEDRTA
jgi:hypothetical protein